MFAYEVSSNLRFLLTFKRPNLPMTFVDLAQMVTHACRREEEKTQYGNVVVNKL